MWEGRNSVKLNAVRFLHEIRSTITIHIGSLYGTLRRTKKDKVANKIKDAPESDASNITPLLSP